MLNERAIGDMAGPAVAGGLLVAPLIATDGSTSARAAMTTAVRFPWPGGTRGSAVVAKQVRADIIAMGWRGHGPVPRLLAGSVSRGVANRSSTSW